MMQSRPFARSIALFAAIQAMGLNDAIATYGQDVSRGKGKDKFSGLATNHRQTTLKNVPVGGGKREVARRQRQIASGMLKIA